MMVKSSRKITGFTLPELMISMVIAAIVMTMAINIYIDMKNQYNKLNNKHQINSKQLMTKQIFYNAISRAGFVTKYGDMYQELVDNSGDNSGDIFGKFGILTIGKSPINEIQGLPESLSLDPEACAEKVNAQSNFAAQQNINCIQLNTDYIAIQRASLSSTLKTNSSNNIFKVNDFQKGVLPENDISTNNYLVLCNVFECDLVKAMSVTGDFVSTYSRVENKFKAGDYVGKYILEIFFVADSGQKDKQGKEIYSLYEYVKQNANDSEIYELVNDISELKIEYVLNADINQGSAQLNWKQIGEQPISVKSDSIAALKISFKVAGEIFSKIFLLENI
ncbi:prepilin-type N-terminal cleavage/methylation domain-containing protein [Allofrancisella guangzhouensis]|uniref:N-terminal cleavage protein n=1 Tax=Allofrancisella guangzhouensis TaxID=594679 RepID=A0A0A8E975_9GAMM|nr:prepilin-type N-terminal cleavage/methylation domain-containing protein [Allofrancisella guangzhouensis]AJC48711.1 N-terminal cleavage protein [Allofrancisella guangzhouensis]MBK2026805.1 prepilin-type N-terminal cleavage/methylation domain-containing protein [Allofrancisella guangzhouensis]MBK2044266.1 prepilin-type N-terminal cleavage/methylation domain-containing protein [Allofrancisella guangzhouensis]MBK2045174.1 prepilin-type N-terminal cleavage/methylation domain-containing protein [A